MNGVHDMGGMQGFGPVRPEANGRFQLIAGERRWLA